MSAPEIDSEIIKAIQIRKKGKRPWLDTILLQNKKEGISCDDSEIECAIQRLQRNGKIEDPGKDGKTSHFLRDSTIRYSSCTEVTGYSMVKHIKGYKMSEATGGSEKIFVHAFHGATTDHMNSHYEPKMKKNPKRIVLHCGTNDVSNGYAPEEIADKIVDLAKSLKHEENAVFVPGIVRRGDPWNEKVTTTNRILEELCMRKITFYT